MEHFDFIAPAELYVAVGRGLRPRGVTYKRFATGAEAIRYAIETIGSDKLGATVVEAGDARWTADEIRQLYLRADYPLPRAIAPD